jgi:hypothetical protein
MELLDQKAINTAIYILLADFVVIVLFWKEFKKDFWNALMSLICTTATAYYSKEIVYIFLTKRVPEYIYFLFFINLYYIYFKDIKKNNELKLHQDQMYILMQMVASAKVGTLIKNKQEVYKYFYSLTKTEVSELLESIPPDLLQAIKKAKYIRTDDELQAIKQDLISEAND